MILGFTVQVGLMRIVRGIKSVVIYREWDPDVLVLGSLTGFYGKPLGDETPSLTGTKVGSCCPGVGVLVERWVVSGDPTLLQPPT